ncbi:MAG TPA: deoxyguanosinetriphosphate triphosphohydrolase [Trebonia sp.]|nr:deoxyguanosinetriphosphate triphosphohydrolase [Trebonia sp.]
MTYTSHDAERWVAEPPKRPERTQFQRDRARVLHSSALRRLAAKTQVLRAGSADFPRTRLTHSLEVAQIGRDLGAVLGCDPDLVDAAGLAHDLGHPPFGHNGESALAALADPGGPLACGGFEGNAQSLRLLTRLEPKVPGAGLNLTRATLDAALKYPWAAPATPGTDAATDSAAAGTPPAAPENVTLHLPPKYGAYQDDIAVFDWIRAAAPGRRRCLEAQVMDWADDVAYSVHDLEDGLDAGLVSIKNLKDSSERSVVSSVARAYYCPPSWAVTAAELDTVFAELMELDCWQFSFDGGPAALAAAKNLTSELVGRFCQAAEVATKTAAGTDRLTRYAADLVIPRRQLLECALLKAVAAHYVMRRQAAVDQQAGERAVIAELALAIERGAPATLDPVFQPAWDAAASDQQRHRVVIDQLASLTDTSALAWHDRLAG